MLALVTGATLSELMHIFLYGYWAALGSAALTFAVNAIARSRPAF
jgi:hypothetical protein